MRHLLLLLVLFASASGMAEQKIYRSVDENGNPIFTDIPPKDASEAKTEVDVTPANTYQSGSARPAYEPGSPATADDTFEGYYQNLEVTAPANEDNLRDNAGNVHIQGYLQPSLRAGHKLRLVFDGTMTELEPDGLEFNLSNVDRGSHQVQLVVVDGQGSELMKSENSIFHLQRYSPPTTPSPPAKAQ